MKNILKDHSTFIIIISGLIYTRINSIYIKSLLVLLMILSLYLSFKKSDRIAKKDLPIYLAGICCLIFIVIISGIISNLF